MFLNKHSLSLKIWYNRIWITAQVDIHTRELQGGNDLDKDNENAIINASDVTEGEDFDLDELEAKLQSQLEEGLSDLEFLEEEREKIGNPDNLGSIIQNVIWEQFINQVASTAGEDFIRENNGLTLDLRNEAHIQTTDAFAQGKIATHNTEIDYQQRYDDWQSNFQRDEKGNIVTHTTRTGTEEATLVKGARKPFDEGRPSGSVEKHTDMDHTVSAGEIIRDPAANAHMTKDEQIAFANSGANLNEMDSSLNRSKSDMSMTDWLDTPNANGQKPNEIFDISEEQDRQLREKDAEARAEYEKQKKEGEKRSVELGKKSQRQEAFRIGGKALRAVVMQLLAELVKEIIAKLVTWFKSAKKAISTLLDSLKVAITSFVKKLKTHLVNSTVTAVTTIATAMFGPVVNTIMKAVTLLKQGWKSLKDAIAYIKNPENKGKPIGILILEVGKIVMAGLTAAGAIVLGEVIEKALIAIPGAGAVFAFEIPLLGSLANILGIFLGAIVAGIIGAIAINQIDKSIAKNKRIENTSAKIEKGNQILQTQSMLKGVTQARVEETKIQAVQSIAQRHAAASALFDAITNDASQGEIIVEDMTTGNEETFSRISDSQEECDKTQVSIEEINDSIDKRLDSIDDLLDSLL